MKTLKTLLSLAATLSLVASSAQAQTTYTWTQTTMAPQDWTDAANWDGNGVFVSGSNNDLVFFPDTSTRNPIGTQTYTNLPASLSMRNLTLNGRGPNSTASSFSIIGSNTETWTIGDGSTGTVSYNPASGGGGDRYHNYTLNVDIDLNQSTTFTGNSAVPRGFVITGDSAA